MARGLTADLEGAPEVEAAFRKIGVRTGIFGRQVVAESALNIQTAARKRLSVPKEKAGPRYSNGRKTESPYPEVDSGRLRGSIQIEYLNGGFTAEIGTDVHYAPHIEFGTKRNMPARPYLRPSFDDEEPVFVRRIKAEVKRAIRGVS